MDIILELLLMQLIDVGKMCPNATNQSKLNMYHNQGLAAFVVVWNEIVCCEI